METVVSGIRPTGNLHLGNYFGAVKNFLAMQEGYRCFFFVADYHSLTTHPKAENLQNNIRNVMVEYLASGLDPEKCTLYVQSDLPEVPELYLIFNMLAYKGELERVVTFKDKARSQPDNVNAGLLTYPVLMAVDILVQKADKVPVGKDQEQHLEMTRTFARRFNHLYGNEFFKEPEAFNFGAQLIKVPGLDGSGKMGKSEGPNNAIFLADEPEEIRKKVMRAVTDAGPQKMNDEMSEPVKNVFSLLEIVSEKETVQTFTDAFNDCSIRYGDLKKQLAEDMIRFTTPLREKIHELKKDTAYIEKVRKMGAEKARENAGKVLREVRKIIGIAYGNL